MPTSETTPTNPLLSFPLELWYHIVDLQPHPGEVCGPLTLVCHSFRNFFQPLLFRTIFIRIPSGSFSQFEAQIAFCQTERILPAIKRCRLQFPWYPRHDASLAGSNHLNILSYHRFHRIFPQLEFISFTGTVFCDQAHAGLAARLQNVKEVRLRECSPYPVPVNGRRHSPEPTTEYPLLRIHRLRISGSLQPILSYWLSLIQPDQLQSLAVHDSRYPEFPSSSDPSSSHKFPNLRSLVIDGTQLQTWRRFRHFLSRCPGLAMIRIINAPTQFSEKEIIPIPTLRAIYGSPNPKLLTAFINRADTLQHVHLGHATPELAWHSLQAFQGNRQTITSLSFTVTKIETEYDPNELLMSFPNLKALELGFSYSKPRPEFVEHVYDLLANPVVVLPLTLEHLAIKFSFMNDLAWQEVLEPLVLDHSWAINFPRLRYLEVSEKKGPSIRFDHVRGRVLEEVQLWDDLVKYQLAS